MKFLQILHLEDSSIDAEFIATTLAEEELDCEITELKVQKGLLIVKRCEMH